MALLAYKVKTVIIVMVERLLFGTAIRKQMYPCRKYTCLGIWCFAGPGCCFWSVINAGSWGQYAGTVCKTGIEFWGRIGCAECLNHRAGFRYQNSSVSVSWSGVVIKRPE